MSKRSTGMLAILYSQPSIVCTKIIICNLFSKTDIKFSFIFIHSVYISGRPFVLRDASEPKRTLSISDRAENLEAIENRLKNDILQEAARYVC